MLIALYESPGFLLAEDRHPQIESKRPTVSEQHSRRMPICATLAYTLVVALGGCSNRAHTDLYQQRMASEIRVLEDQLYDADYQNRVLRDKLQQCKPAEVPTQTPSSSGVESSAPSRDSQSDSKTEESSDMDDGFESIDDLELPDFDEGEQVDPDALTDPVAPIPDDNTDGEGSVDDLLAPLQPAPGGPEPPSKRDTEIPQIDPGEILPPPAADDGGLPKPPGQIKLPDSVQAALGVPAGLQIHPGLSGGQRVDDSIDNMKIVLNVVDRIGKPVNLEDFDIDADLSIVILDPDLEPSAARIGRWDFTTRQLATFVESDPISGLHIPIKWQEKQPSGEDMIVHVRLRAEDEEMRCERRLKVVIRTAIAEWMPRADDKQR